MQGYKILFPIKKYFGKALKKYYDKEKDGNAKYKQVGYVNAKLKMWRQCKNAGRFEVTDAFLLTLSTRLKWEKHVMDVSALLWNK